MGILVTLITTGVGVFGVEIGKKLLDNRRARQESQDKHVESAEQALQRVLEGQIDDLRKEKTEQIEELQRRIDALSHDLDTWQQRYYDLQREHAVLVALPCHHAACSVRDVKAA